MLQDLCRRDGELVRGQGTHHARLKCELPGRDYVHEGADRAVKGSCPYDKPNSPQLSLLDIVHLDVALVQGAEAGTRSPRTPIVVVIVIISLRSCRAGCFIPHHLLPRSEALKRATLNRNFAVVDTLAQDGACVL